MKERIDISRSITEVIRENPMIFVSVLSLIIFALILFYFEIPEEDHFDESTISHNWPMGGGYGVGPDLEKGDTIKVEYEVLDGEAVDVSLYKRHYIPGEVLPAEEELILQKENSHSGNFIHTADEDASYMVYFEGSDYTVHYTIDVIKPGPTIEDASLVLDLFGLFMLLLIVPVLWMHFKVKNPKYISNHLKILPIAIIVIGVLFYIFNGIANRMEPDVPLFIFVIVMGVKSYFSIIEILGHYRLVTRDNTIDVANRIEEYLKKKDIYHTPRIIISEDSLLNGIT